MGRKLIKTESKRCHQCKRKMIRMPRQSASRWPKRRFCSQRCAHKAQIMVKPKRCPQCGKKFNKGRSRGTFCGALCAGMARMVKRPKRRRYVKIGRGLAHRIVMARLLGRELEKWEMVHHKNGDTQNNSPRNLELWVRPHPCGQRVRDLVTFIVENYRDLVVSAMQ